MKLYFYMWMIYCNCNSWHNSDFQAFIVSTFKFKLYGFYNRFRDYSYQSSTIVNYEKNQWDFFTNVVDKGTLIHVQLDFCTFVLWYDKLCLDFCEE